MKALVYHGRDDLRVEEVEEPQPGPGELLVEMKACGICGSDLMDWYIEPRAPLVLGHEPSGVVLEVGEGVEKFKPGDRVFVHHHVSCMSCHYCTHGSYTLCPMFRKTHIRPGGMAERFVAQRENVMYDTLKIPDDVSFEEATLIEPMACCIRALRKIHIEPGDSAAIIGSGPSGVFHIQLLRILGAGFIAACDLSDYRVEAALKFGADLAVNARDVRFDSVVRDATGGRGADLVVVTAPSPEAFKTGLRCVRRGGTVLLFAPSEPKAVVEVSLARLFFNEIFIIPSYSASHVETRMALELISRGRVKAREMITHTYPLERAPEAFETARGAECLKVVVLGGGGGA